MKEIVKQSKERTVLCGILSTFCHNYSYNKEHIDSSSAKEECIFYLVQIY